MTSILKALTIGLTLSLGAVFAVQWSAGRVAIEAMMEDYVAADLRQDAEELSTALAVNTGGESVVGISHFDPVYLQPGSGHYFQITADDVDTIRSPSLGNFNIEIGATAPGRTETSRRAGPDRQQLLVSAIGVERNARQFTIAVAADMLPIRERIDAFLVRYTLLTLTMFAVLLALQVWIVRRALAPLRRAQADVARLEHGEITQLGDSVPSEVLPLIRNVNHLLAVLGERLRRSRESLGNLSHALKTPLTLLTQMSDHESIRADPALHTQIQEQLRALGGSIDRELRRARVADQSSSPAVDLLAEIDLLVLTMRKLHYERDLDIATTISPAARFRGDREDLIELAGNLLDNACKWASRQVGVSIGVDATDGFLLTIEDDGPGCADQDLERIAERGVRLDEARAGHGLGLAIVRDIVSSYGGELSLGRSSRLGGMLVSVSIPTVGGLGWRAPDQEKLPLAS
ncbi:sensor histidine kinase [Propionivibrio sp.]|uniref:sensor histidine kinase n=1 Tax=Propionivibrio sp. TaxID=2212460 RepID=UPI0025D677A7|nr:sensor histidine kinase [Propionivibrio sp.]